MPQPATLVCGYCDLDFIGTPAQVNAIKYKGQKAYCSPTCRAAAKPYHNFNKYPRRTQA